MSFDRRDMIIAGAALALGAGGMAFAVTAGGFGGQASVEKTVRNYIMTHPEILPEAMAALQSRETKKIVDANRAQIEMPFGTAWSGAADGDVTLVQFFDYACGYCRAALPDVERLLAEDKKLKIVYRELPILGEPSDLAARASLAVANKGGNYSEFHRTMYGAGRPDSVSIAAALAKAGATADGANSDQIAGEITTNLDLQRQLQLTGTPSWIVGDTVLNGAVGYDALKTAIAEARAKRG
ncbi:MAG: DsbA family protein [Pseudomonadota bacterium]